MNETEQNLLMTEWWRLPCALAFVIGLFWLLWDIPTKDEEEKRALDKKILSERWKHIPGKKWFDE